MDLLERLQERINSIQNLPYKCLADYLDANSGLRIYSLSGSNVVQAYMDGSKDEEVNFEIAIRSDDSAQCETTLWSIQSVLEKLKQNEIKSSDSGFIFNSLTITNKPFINQEDEKGLFTYMLDIQANITTEEQ